jgi:ADP-ribose diphosphatase
LSGPGPGVRMVAAFVMLWYNRAGPSPTRQPIESNAWRVKNKDGNQPMSAMPAPPQSRRVPNGPYFTLMADAEGVGYVHCDDAVAVVPLTDVGDVLLAVEYSPAFGTEILTLVSGLIEPDESPEEAANRELREELGYRAGRLDFLGELHPFKYLTTRLFAFLARDLVPSKLAGDETHAITERRIPLNGSAELCRSGELNDAPAIAALTLAGGFLEMHDN